MEISSEHNIIIRAALISYYLKCQKEIATAQKREHLYMVEFWQARANETKEAFCAIVGHDIEEDVL